MTPLSEALAAAKRCAAENQRLVEALQRIADRGCRARQARDPRRCSDSSASPDLWCDPCIARAALEPKEPT